MDVDFEPTPVVAVPGQVTNVTATAGAGSASLTWSAPSSGGAVTKYTITPYIGSEAQPTTTVTGTPPATAATVSELKNGTSYTFKVTASNSVGSGPASEPSNAVTPTAPTAPAAPTGVTATAGSEKATVTWTAPSNGGSPITKYTITPYVGTEAKTATTITGTPPATSATITGLTNGTTYTFKVAASNAIGEGPPSSASNAVTPGNTPSAPTGVTATAGNEEATVTWTAPSNGGSQITKYTITPYVGTEAKTATTITGTPPETSAIVTGLSNGTTYTFKVTASNAIGEGPPSSASNAVTPTGPPSAPTGVTAGAGNERATVTWTAPSNGGSQITKYTITPYVGTEAKTATTITGTPPATSATITGLTNGTTYTFKVAASNAIGEGPPSSASNAVTPSTAPNTIFGSATPKTIDSGDSSSVELGVKFSSEVAGNVTGIRFYKATTNTGTHIGSLWSASGTLLASATFTGESASGWQQVSFSTPVAIAANTTYVAAYLAPKGHYSETESGLRHRRGEQPAAVSAREQRQRQRRVHLQRHERLPIQQLGSEQLLGGRRLRTHARRRFPGQVTNVAATAGAGSASLTWSAPSSGGAVTKYTITPYIGSEAQPTTTVTGTPPATTATVSELKNGTSYTFKVTASNSVGSGPASEPSNAVTPTAPTAPAAPTGVTATAASEKATVTWTAPSNGGSQITKYTITPYVGTEAKTATTITGTPPATSATITGLTNGTTYTFKVAASNAIGEGPPSSASNAVTPSAVTDTIFGSATPKTIDSGDPSSVELGVKFSSEVAGNVTGIRFYKATTNTGTHIGSLWSASGTLLASATFTGESASGWQQVSFSTPVAIAANTTYVAAYLAPKGHYSETELAFATAGVSNPPLSALANSVSANGVYTYSATSVFPSSSWEASNYWVDVDFQPSG